MATHTPDSATEVAILTRVFETATGEISPELARLLLGLGFAESDHRRMAELATKSNAGDLSEAERIELENYNDVGHLLAVMQSRARQAVRAELKNEGLFPFA